MRNRNFIREFFSWMMLAVAVVLLSATVMFAQTKTIEVESKDGKTHLTISSTDKGKTVTLDTTFESTGDADIEKIISDFGKAHGQIITFNEYKTGKGDKSDKKKGSKQLIIETHIDDIEGDVEEKIEKSMKKMRKSLDEMEMSLEQMKISIDDFNFDFEFDIDESNDGSIKKRIIRRGPAGALADSMDDNHVIILGETDEEAPVFEKTITTKDGKKAFIYKRIEKGEGSDMKKSRIVEREPDFIREFTVFPNPTVGKFTVKFKSPEKRNFIITVTDEIKKTIFTESLNNFSGEFSKEINLAENSKGSYAVKITSDGETLVKKVIVN